MENALTGGVCCHNTNPQVPARVGVAPFPYPPFTLDFFHILLKSTVGLALVSAYMFPMSRLLRALALEKARKQPLVFLLPPPASPRVFTSIPCLILLSAAAACLPPATTTQQKQPTRRCASAKAWR